jgi:transmembrane sensor
MTQESQHTGSEWSAAIDQAAAWIAHRTGSSYKRADIKGFELWLKANSINRDAFETVRNSWVEAHVRLGRLGKAQKQPWWRSVRMPLLQTVPIAAYVCVSLLVLLVPVIVYLMRPGSIVSVIGEKREVLGEDGSQLTLNTASSVRMEYTDTERLVHLDQGEVHFQVAKKPSWPFVVDVSGLKVTALGTSFVIRKESESTSVTLESGKVVVATASSWFSAKASDGLRQIVLTSGQRVTFTERHPPVVDCPDVLQLTSWRKGMVQFDGLSVAQAVDEMNRYSTTKLSLEWDAGQYAPAEGAFRIGDVASFAASIAHIYKLDVYPEGKTMILRGTPNSRSLSPFSAIPAKHRTDCLRDSN